MLEQNFNINDVQAASLKASDSIIHAWLIVFIIDNIDNCIHCYSCSLVDFRWLLSKKVRAISNNQMYGCIQKAVSFIHCILDSVFSTLNYSGIEDICGVSCFWVIWKKSKHIDLRYISRPQYWCIFDFSSSNSGNGSRHVPRWADCSLGLSGWRVRLLIPPGSLTGSIHAD